MSSFDGQNLFGSGPHRVEWRGVAVDAHEFAFPGEDGSFRMVHGLRKATGRIAGSLRAADAADLAAQEAAILRCVAEGGAHTLIDNFDLAYGDVVLTDFTRCGPRQRTAEGLLVQDYVIGFAWLQPVQP